MDANDVLIRPVISEKTTEMMEQNKYVFRVSRNANKLNVRQAIKEVFGVQPFKINIMNMRGKTRRVRYEYGNRSAWKKAIVTLKPGDKIEIFDTK